MQGQGKRIRITILLLNINNNNLCAAPIGRSRVRDPPSPYVTEPATQYSPQGTVCLRSGFPEHAENLP